MEELAPDFDEFFGFLIDHGVEFLVVGAYALAYHGAPRYTGVIDVFLRPTTENGERLLNALSALGFPPPNLRPEQVIEPSRLIQMGVEPVQIHVMSAISGVSWDEAWAGRAELIRNKRAAGRLKDLADIEAIGG